MPPTVRTRIAPSPTGLLHIGTVRTALFNYLFSKKYKGKLVLRIEDTDTERSTKEFEEDILNGLSWIGIKYDEFYRQSERKEIYKKYIQKLLDAEDAFYCYHTKGELEKEKEEQVANKKVPRHICEHKNQNRKDLGNGSSVIRLKGKNEKIKFTDLIRGDIEYDMSLLGDMVIAKDKETPLYNLANVIDDAEMKITHVIRGEDHIPNTPKQILIYKALNIKNPLYAHLPLILGPDKSKLSKRHGATSINEYKAQGYLPDALVNFMAFLGWNPGNNEELMNIDEIIKSFSLDKVQKGGAVFNVDKLNWFNKEYIKQMDIDKLVKDSIPFAPAIWQEKITKDKKYWKKIVELERDRVSKLQEIGGGLEFFFEKPNYENVSIIPKNESPDNTINYLENIINLLSVLNDKNFNHAKIKETVWDYAEEKGRGSVLWPFRVALTGKDKSPDPFSVSAILGKDESLDRLKHAVSHLKKLEKNN